MRYYPSDTYLEQNEENKINFNTIINKKQMLSNNETHTTISLMLSSNIQIKENVVGIVTNIPTPVSSEGIRFVCNSSTSGPVTRINVIRNNQSHKI